MSANTDWVIVFLSLDVKDRLFTFTYTSACQVYHVTGGARQAKLHFWPNSGVHLLVLGPWRQVMMHQHFLTYQPAEHFDLAAALAALQPGRIVVLAAVVRRPRSDPLLAVDIRTVHENRKV